MNFLLQKDEVCKVERNTIISAAMLTDAKLIRLSLQALRERRIDAIPVEAVPVGTVEFVSEVMSARDIALPEHLSYPDCLRSFLLREIKPGVFADAIGDVFVKPYRGIKRFTGALLPDLLADPDTFTLAADYPVWISEPVSFVSEWRYYILNGAIVGAGRYDDGPDESPIPDPSTIKLAADAMSSRGAPAGYALDFGVLNDGRTALIEANDGWALGYYKGSCTHVDYARILHARWMDLLGRSCSQRF